MEWNELSLRPIRINGAIYFGLMFGITFGFSIEFYGEFFFELRSIFFGPNYVRSYVRTMFITKKKHEVFWHARHGLGLFDFFTCDVWDTFPSFSEHTCTMFFGSKSFPIRILIKSDILKSVNQPFRLPTIQTVEIGIFYCCFCLKCMRFSLKWSLNSKRIETN